LRKVLGEAFAFLPTLEIDRKRGMVERLELRPFRGRKVELAEIVGRSLALWSWLGVADLHWENMALGVDRRGRIVFGPLDIETIFGDMALPTQTKLIPAADPDYAEELRHAAGVHRALAHIGAPIRAEHLVAIVAGYRAALDFLERAAIARVVAGVKGVHEAPIRVLLRSTADYVHGAEDPPLLDGEIEQLERGDVPYFFRLWGKRGLRFYRDATLRKVGFADVPLEPLLPRSLRSRSRAILRDEGLVAVIGAFDHPTLTGRHEGEGVAITLSARRILIQLGEERIECPRNLRVIVGSVYF